MTLLLLRELLLLLALAGAADLSFPTQFSAAYSTIAHQIPETSEYPSRVKHYQVNVDRSLGGSRIVHEEDGSVLVTLIRNYNAHYEVRLEKVDGIETCEYSFMGESMPEPNLHVVKDSIGEIMNDGSVTNGYSYQDQRQYVELYFHKDSNLPSRVHEFYIDENNKPNPVFSTVYNSITEGPQDPSLFDVEKYIESGKCSRNGKGWPYQLIFGPFVRV
ncbi:hypothetical protein WA556_002189 [Blastocystis sp. ATCC 50177/Nand II]